MASVNLGRVGFMLRGEWNSSVTYAALDVVSYNGNSYAAKIASTNVIPDEINTGQYWQILANANFITVSNTTLVIS